MVKLRIVFAGTPEFAAKHLGALLGAGYEVCAVLTQPDRPAGRGRQLTASPVKQLALQNDISVYQPQNFKDEQIQPILQELKPDLLVVVAYGLFLPKTILELPRFGCINVHASLLPEWRGAAPIQYAILHGDEKTGVTVMQMDEGMDSGPILLQNSCEIQPEDTAGILHDRLIELGRKVLLEALEKIATKTIESKPQDDKLATYAKKIRKADARLDWYKSAAELERQIRAFNPWPIAFCEIGGQQVRIWQALALYLEVDANPGKIIQMDKFGIDVATGKGVLRLQILQFPGGKPLIAKEMLKGKKGFFLKNEFK
jgi:methionyl-tRNA formyltransferase